MSIELLKKQASRLAQFLGERHRLNLKHSSALEAIAAVHGARNWQTLAAGAESTREIEPELPSTAPAEQLAMAWGVSGAPVLSLPRFRWLHHAIAVGKESDAWVQRSFDEAVQAGIPAILLQHRDASAAVEDEGRRSAVERFPLSRLVEVISSPPKAPSIVELGPDEFWSESVLNALRARFSAGIRGPLVLGLPALDMLTRAQLDDLVPLAMQGRAVGVSLRCCATGPKPLPASLGSHLPGMQILAQMTHQVFLTDAREQAREAMLSRFESSPAVLLSGVSQVQF